MLGGKHLLEGLRSGFTERIKERLPIILNKSDLGSFSEISDDQASKLREALVKIIDEKLEELTPTKVKELVEQMIREHLGWLVFWGGAFGFIIGFITAFFL